MGEEDVVVEVEANELLGGVYRSLQWQNADLFALGRRDHIIRLGEIAGYLDMARQQREIHAIHVALPPAGERSRQAMHDEVREGIRRAHRRFAGDDIRSEIVDAAFDRLILVDSTSFDAEGLLGVLATASAHDIVIVGEASEYRFAALQGPPPPALAEDIWSAHLYRLMLEAEASARVRNSYVLLEAGQSLPLRQTNRDLLQSAGDVGVAGTTDMAKSGADDVIAKVEDLFLLVDNGEIGKALAALDKDGRLSELQKWALRIELQHQAGLTESVRKLLDEGIAYTESLPHEGFLSLARIATEVDRDDFAYWLVELALPRLRSQVNVEDALRVAVRIRRRPLIDRVMNALATLHPRSRLLPRQRARQMAEDGAYAEAAVLFAEAGGDEDLKRAEMFQLLSASLSDAALAEPSRLVMQLEQAQPEHAASLRYEVIRSLERHGKRDKAVALFMERDFPWSAHWIAIACQALQRAISAGDEHPEAVARLVDVALVHLASAPEDGQVRTALADLLDPVLLGSHGLAILLLNVIDRARRPITVRPRAPVAERKRLVDISVLPRIMRRVLQALKQSGNGVVLIGDSIASVDVLGADPDATLEAILRFLGHYAPDPADPLDEAVVQQLIVTAVAIAPLAEEADEDLTVVRAAATHLIIGGRPQVARNLAEQVQTMAGDTPERRRHALLVFADVYARLGRVREALIALGAALECAGTVSWDMVWYEQNLLFRLLRDVGMADRAIDLLPRAREALAELGLGQVYKHRLDTLELQARDVLRRTGRSEGESLDTLLSAVILNTAEIVRSGDELLPVTVLLRQMMREAEASRRPLPEGAEATFAAAMELLPPPHRSLVMAIGEDPDLAAVVSMAGNLAPAQFADDTSYDLRLARTVAEKLARSAAKNSDADAFVYAIEVLSDQGVQVIGTQGGLGEPDRLLAAPDGPITAARQLAERGVPIVFSSLGDTGLALARVTNEDVSISMTPAEIFDPAAFRHWTAEFPYKYRDLADDEFRAATASLGCSHLPDRALFVASQVTQLPPTVLTVDGDLAGMTRAFATVPSLGWLKASIAADRQGDGSAAAWIPVSTDLSDTATLALLRNDLADVLSEANVPLHTSPRPPASFAKADLGILGAHGGLSDENQFFRSVSDDRHEPADIRELADLLRGTRVAILFVCSGGRRDVHPESGGAIGLSRRLLDQGLSAVIATSWPMEFFVARPWLQGFLPSWRNGTPLIDACFAANQAVAKAFSYNLRRSLAMTLYGNPYLTTRQGS